MGFDEAKKELDDILQIDIHLDSKVGKWLKKHIKVTSDSKSLNKFISMYEKKIKMNPRVCYCDEIIENLKGMCEI